MVLECIKLELYLRLMWYSNSASLFAREYTIFNLIYASPKTICVFPGIQIHNLGITSAML